MKTGKRVSSYGSYSVESNERLFGSKPGTNKTTSPSFHGESKKTRLRLLFWKADTTDLLTEENRRHKPIRSCSVRWGVTRFPSSWKMVMLDCHFIKTLSDEPRGTNEYGTPVRLAFSTTSMIRAIIRVISVCLN
jgi:hypothetical protein